MPRPSPIAAEDDPGVASSGPMSLRAQVVVRSVSRLALGIWIGAQLTTAFVVWPVTVYIMRFVPQLVRHEDWQQRTAAYAFGGIVDRVNLLSLGCSCLAFVTTVIEIRLSGRRKPLAFVPALLVALGGLLILASSTTRMSMYGAIGPPLLSAYSRYAAIVVGETSLAVIAIVILVWLQIIPSQSDSDRMENR